MAYDHMLWLIYLTSKVGRWKFLWTAVPGYRPQQLPGKFPLAQVVCFAGISVEPQSLKAGTTWRDQNALTERKRGGSQPPACGKPAPRCQELCLVTEVAVTSAVSCSCVHV